MLDCIIFDLDGTLVDTLGDISDAMNRTLAYFGFETKSQDNYMQLIGGGSRNMVDSLVPADIAAQVYDHFLAQYEYHMTDRTCAYPDVAATLRQLQQDGIKLAVVTNKYYHQAVEIIEALFGDIQFDAIQGYVPGAFRKPHPQTTFAVLDQLDVSPSNALFVGDTPTDMKTAAAAGIDSVFVTWGYGELTDADNCQPMKCIDHISGLTEVIQSPEYFGRQIALLGSTFDKAFANLAHQAAI